MIELRNIDGELDEVVAKDAFVHIERMSDGEFYIGITTSDAEVKVFIVSRTGRAVVDAHASQKSGAIEETNR